MVGAVENVKKTKLNKIQRSLIPAGIKSHQTGIAVEFERANCAARRSEAKNGDDPQTQARKPRLNAKTRTIRLNRGIEQNVQQSLVPRYVSGFRQRRAGDV